MVGMERFGEGSVKRLESPPYSSALQRCMRNRSRSIDDAGLVGTIQGNQLIIKVLVSKPQVANVSTPDQRSFTADGKLCDIFNDFGGHGRRLHALGIQPISWKEIVERPRF